MILALDPSSSRTGYALMTGPQDLVECGLLTPDVRDAPPAQRILDLAKGLAELLAETKPDAIVLEITSGHVAGRLKRNVSGLGIYGMAVGFLWRECLAANPPGGVHTLQENHWTRGVPKSDRTDRIALLFKKKYRREQDPGGDAADAVGVGMYFLRMNLLPGVGKNVNHEGAKTRRTGQ